jgi:hypothetical protein
MTRIQPCLFLVATTVLSMAVTPSALHAQSFTFFDVNQVLGTGQSLSVGWLGAPALSTTQPFQNLMFDTGVWNLPGTFFVPLVHSGVEMPYAGLANQSTAIANVVFAGLPPPTNTHVMMASAHGWPGYEYALLKKGTVFYAVGMSQVTVARQIATGLNKTHVVRAVVCVHGETDHLIGNLGYGSDLKQWQQDYETDVQLLTGQTEPVPMLHTQISCWSVLHPTSVIPMAQLQASVQTPGKVILVGPKYFLPYLPDGVHLTNQGYRTLGEYYGKAYAQTVFRGLAWQPVRPIQVMRQGATITVGFQVPVPPLVLDTTAVSNPGNFGFEFADSSATPPTITTVQLTGPKEVTIGLSAVPTGADKWLRYAFTGVVPSPAGPTTGPRGNLRDSDATQSQSTAAAPLPNWCVHFEMAVP